MQVTLGGDRLGSGKKNKVMLKHYYRSTHNLEQDFKSSLAPGILYPCLKIVGTNGDTFDIDMDNIIRTLPTKGPLFGSYKLQVDIFECPIRLYQGILHNNPINIGLKMNQVYLPKMEIKTQAARPGETDYIQANGSDFYTSQVSTNSLVKYMGLSGIGLFALNQTAPSDGMIKRKIQCVPVLAYYDIFKNYYSNKQEENAYVITPNFDEAIVPDNVKIDEVDYWQSNGTYIQDDGGTSEYNITSLATNVITGGQITLIGSNLNENNIEIYWGNNKRYTLKQLKQIGYINYNIYNDNHKCWIYAGETIVSEANSGGITITSNTEIYVNSEIQLTPFKLENIDKMRNRILKLNELGDELVIDANEELLPYSTNTAVYTNGNHHISYNAFKLNGLVVKTYQSDLFNNWVNTDWIEGENGISAISAIDVSDGILLIDALNLGEKVYNYLNRVAVGGGTYEDWQEATYDEKAIRKAESPIYLGGMSAEVLFEEVISNSETKIDNDFQPLGTLGGRGLTVGQNGGRNITVHFKEPGYVIGIASLTPRICQTQGNDWDITELNSLDDLHKPALDGIGFQDLVLEQMAWWDTKLKTDGLIERRHSAGKVPAWINYTTAVDKAYGDFAEADGKAFMVLARNYEAYKAQTGPGRYEWEVKDVTTYIDPSKFNYAFAYDDLASQNFWAQLHFKVIARRKMSAHQIPNL